MARLLRLPLVLAFAALASQAHAQPRALDPVRFGTNWYAEAEHGGFYQALADGTYERYGLAVTIVPGGPQAPNRALLKAGQIDLYMSGNLLQAMNNYVEGVPVLEIAAIFQKEPQVMIAHPNVGVDELADLATLPRLYMGGDVFASTFKWMKANWPAFNDEQYRAYQFNIVPFLTDPQSAQQGYVTSEPFAIEQTGGFKPVVFLLADYGFDTPSTMIEGLRSYVEANPDIVQRFVDASIVGWYTYLYGDNSAGNALIKAENPSMTDAQIAFSVAAMKDHGLVDSGIALTEGIGCFDETKVASFQAAMVAAGVIDPSIDLTGLVTNAFVCNGVGLDLRP